MSSTTYGIYAAFVLAGMGAPITRNNIDKLVAIMKNEGTQATFNPIATNTPANGATDFNSVGVKNYPDFTTGVQATVSTLSNSRTGSMKTNLLTDGPYPDFITATQAFYNSWGGTMQNISQSSADGAGGTAVSGDVSSQDAANAANTVTADPNVRTQLGNIAQLTPDQVKAGQVAGTNAAGSAASALASLNPLKFMQQIWASLTSRSNWVRVAYVVGAIMLAFFGMSIISKSFGGPGATDIAKKGATVAAVA